MAEYIEKEAVVHHFMTKRHYLTKDLVMDAAYEVSKFPAADVAPVVHGEWLDVGYKIRCSVCDNGVFLGTTDPLVHHAEKENFNYCPNCGARMDGAK